MAEEPKTVALSACDEALRSSISNISSVLLNALISAKTEAARKSAMERAQRGVQLSKDTHAAMKGIVETIFT